jgi:hypothetical protein
LEVHSQQSLVRAARHDPRTERTRFGHTHVTRAVLRCPCVPGGLCDHEPAAHLAAAQLRVERSLFSRLPDESHCLASEARRRADREGSRRGQSCVSRVCIYERPLQGSELPLTTARDAWRGALTHTRLRAPARERRGDTSGVYQDAVLTRTPSTPPRGRVQPGAGFDPLRGVTRLQPYLRAGPRQLKPALGGK